MERKDFIKLGSIAATGLALFPRSSALASQVNADSALTAVTKFIEVKGIKFAYRRFGKKNGLPLIFANYLTGTMDNWDPIILDGFAKDREVIIFDNAGVSASGGNTPDNIEAMALDTEGFIDSLGLKQIDLFGFSIGGMVAQQLVMNRPELVRRLILSGTGPRGGEKMTDYPAEIWGYFKKHYPHPDELLLDTFFTQSKSSQDAGWAYLKRIRARTQRDPNIGDKVVPNQLKAIFTWGKPFQGSYDYLRDIKQPTLIIQADKDLIMPPINAFILKQNLPNSFLIMYPDTNHGLQYQYPELFLKQAAMFLNDLS
ncbi:alpha/beta fold hydrolase [Pedobacter sp. L105]|uniref:alpha/beta fold hydrolase n=1 Tax=Pedobacter sp. L105 TaxID=1641871 RepID=UPI00131E509F|nr:alpha/beta hydrolase [Pedobacter sp. L105]